MNDGGSRRAVAEIRFGEDRVGITKVSGRSIHQYWTLLAPHFRDVLLAPQRRSDDGGVAWTWREAADKKPLTAAELAGVRKRLERAKESFEENPVSPLMGDARSGTRSQALIDQVAVKVKAMAESLIAKSDAVLGDFVCRTETGLMIHSWGVASAAPVVYPDSLETGVDGVVLIGGKAARGYEVVIENAKGLSVARMQSDESGEFHFSKMGPGRYRVRVISGKVKFPAKGTQVTVERGTISRLELQSTEDSSDPGDSATNPPLAASTDTSPGPLESASTQKNRTLGWLWKMGGVVLALLLLGGGGWWVWRTWSTSDETAKRVVVQGSSMAPEDFSAKDANAGKTRPSHPAADDIVGLGATADGVGGAIRHPASHLSTTTDRRPTATTGSVRAVSTIGLKVDVLSGVSDARISGAKDANDQEVASTGMGGADGQDTISDEAASVTAPASSEGTTAALPKKNRAKAESGPTILAHATPGGGAQMGEGDAIAVENEKQLPDGKKSDGSVRIAATKKAAARQAPGAISTGERPAAGETTLDEAPTTGPTPEDASPEDVTADKLDGGLPVTNAPTAKVSVVNRGLAPGIAPAASDSLGDDGTTGSVGDQSSPARAPAKRSRNRPGGGKNAPVVGGPSSGEAGKSATAEQNESVPAAAAAAPSPATGSANTTAGNNGDLNAESGPAETGKKPTDTAKNDKKKNDERAPTPSPAHRQPGPKSKLIPNGQRASSDDAQDKGAPDAPLTESLPATPVRADDPAPGFEPVANTMEVEVLFAGWEPRLLADAIIPTMPVRIGAVDESDAIRDKMLAAQKTRLPVTFRIPATQFGFFFELSAASAAGAWHWQEAPVASGTAKTTADGHRADITWSGERLPRGGVQVLRFADGGEAIRLTVNEEGRLVLKCAIGVKCSVFLVVKRLVADESRLAKSESDTRFGWQIDGDAHLPRQNAKDPISGIQDYRLSIPLELSKSVRWECALADRISGWALVTKIQLQAKP